MPEFAEFRPGQPSWVDLRTPEPEVSEDFYRALFGWEVAELGPEAGGYAMFTLAGRNVAGVGPAMTEDQAPAWTTYVCVEDADATGAAVRKWGGTVLVEPMDVSGAGRLAVFADPTGGVVAVWQPRAHHGADIANEPGSFCWNELQTRDTSAAVRFYSAVFGWRASIADTDGMPYTEWKLGEDTVGGMMPMPAEVPGEISAYWLTYFAVEDCDATVVTAAGLGATMLVPPMDVPPGRFSVLADPAGAVFAVIALNPAG